MKKAIKIILIIDHLGIGGAQRQFVELVCGLSKESFDIEVISLSKDRIDYASQIESAGIPLTLIAHSGKWSWSTFRKVYRKLKEYKPDIVHTWLFTADFYGTLAAKLAGVKNVICAMRSTIEDIPNHYRFMYRILKHGMSKMTVNANAIRPGMVHELKISDSKLCTIYNGFDFKTYLPVIKNGKYSAEWNIPENGQIVAMVARMSDQKDYYSFLKAAKLLTEKLNSVYFLLVGDGPLRENIEGWIKEFGIEKNSRVLGSRRDVWQILHHIDVFVLSTHGEGSSNSIMEAMAAAKPVVATDAGGNDELVIDGVTGYLVPPKDVEALTNSIEKMISQPEKALVMGKQGQMRIHQEFVLEKTMIRTKDLYYSLVNSEMREEMVSL